MIRVAITGAAYSANKGAASMVQALVDCLPERVGPTSFVAISTHPKGDRRIYSRASVEVAVASQRPIEMAIVQVPLALLAGLLRKAHLPWRWLCRPAALQAIAEADVIADLSGISFVDGRGFAVLVYNTLVVLVPLALGRPVVKCAQAMGPFRTIVNRSLARLVLPRVRVVCARGDETARHVRELGLRNVRGASDIAFTMQVPESTRHRMRTRLVDESPGPYLVVSPSQVVDTYCTERGIDYLRMMAEFIELFLARTSYTVVLIAHSAQPEAGVNRLNDLPLCRSIYERLPASDRVVFFDEDLLPTELRALIGEGSVLVTSRFHAMVSALAECRPMVVIGWSHKYAEVLEPFGLADAAMSYTDLQSGEAVFDRAQEMLARSADVVSTINLHLPDAVASSRANFDALAEVISSQAAA